ncbi:hypothetical protein BH10PSE3_BH10PSE3_35940 [soil metagenome]
MASIIISAGAASDYPLTSDNVFGIPSTFTTYGYGTWLNVNGPKTVLYSDGPDEIYSYESGNAYIALVWLDGDVQNSTTMDFVLSSMVFNVRYYEGGMVSGQALYTVSSIITDGITFTPNATIEMRDMVGTGGAGPMPFGGLRTWDPGYPAVGLSKADTIINLSATGAVLSGYAGVDTITGGAGGDTLDGGAGSDSLIGGLGDDSYIVDYGDKIVELSGQGFDTVYTAGTYVAVAGLSVERIVATGSAAVAITGNGQAIEIIGNAGVNTLDDGGGAATLNGGANVDVYLVHNAATMVTELAGEGYDTVKTELGVYALPGNVEALIHLGSKAFSGVGNGLSNALTGGGGADTLDGAGGSDVLTGGAGGDLFAFGGLGLGVDRITDFLSGLDHIGLSGLGFGVASLSDLALVVGDAVSGVGQATVRYYASGGLAFDANGGSGAGAVLFASLDGHPSLAIADFVLV